MSPRLVIITVNYACAEEILGGLDALVTQMRDLGDTEYWIVDNHSPDGSAADLRSSIADKGVGDLVQVLDAPGNGGFGAGNNVAIRAGLARDTPPEFFYFLNPDADPRPGAIAKMLAYLEANADVGVVGGALCDEDGTRQSSMFRFPSFASEVETALQFGPASRLLRAHVPTLPDTGTPQSVDWVAGTSFMVRRDVFETAGLFDETFFLYWEEIELCHRIKQAGFQIVGLPDAVVSHIGGVSTGFHDVGRRKPAYWFASRNYFFRKTGLVRSVVALNAVVAVCLALRRIQQFIRRIPAQTPHFLRDFVRYSFTEPKPR